MLLVVDVGNSKISFALFDKGNMVQISSLLYSGHAPQETIESVLNSLYVGKYNIDSCVASSVVDELNPYLTASLVNKLNVSPVYICSDMNLGIEIKSHHPEQFGTDRIANVVAAKNKYKKTPIIVVDSGSATTFDIIDAEGAFIGGVIMPGLNMQLNSLAANTSKLPEIKLDMLQKVQTTINNDTKKAILSGVVNGHAAAIEGLIKKCTKELKEKPYLVGTGGNAILLSKYMNNVKFDIINPYLTTEGINMIYELNDD